MAKRTSSPPEAASPSPQPEQPPISSRAQLIDALRLAVELEHNLMCQYLFAAYSVKKLPSEDISPVELERARRWESLITLIARQEMEHLGLALNLLTAIGGTPSFSRPNFPQPSDYYGQTHIHSTLTRCNLATLQRFQRFEAPDALAYPDQAAPPVLSRPRETSAARHPAHELLDLELHERRAQHPRPTADRLSPGTEPLPPIDPRKALHWCQEETRQPVEAIARMLEQGAQRRQSQARGPVPKGLVGLAPQPVVVKSVQELYEDIHAGFVHLSGELGECNLFIGKKTWQIFGGPTSPQYGSMSDLNQYGLDVIGVTDLKSATRVIRMILEQGEGIQAPPAYLPHTHFCMFTRVVEEMKAHGLEERASRPVVANPMTRYRPDVSLRDEVNLITHPDTLPVAQVFNDCYEVMLTLLLYLYSDAVKTQAQTNALMDAAFFPLMTMFVRPLAELLTEMPAFADGRPGNAGPGFELSGDVLNLPTFDGTWTLFQERLDSLSGQLQAIVARGDRWLGLKGQKVPDPHESRIFKRLKYVRDNMQRLALDWRQDWLNIGRTGNV
ncbi:MAG TPA: ferritin-like domain-containing protein [Archangium sp.]|nr:ferritin-like domain-containing protein [Archangium sp.]